jgi:hypothetical protein
MSHGRAHRPDRCARSRPRTRELVWAADARTNGAFRRSAFWGAVLCVPDVGRAQLVLGGGDRCDHARFQTDTQSISMTAVDVSGVGVAVTSVSD